MDPWIKNALELLTSKVIRTENFETDGLPILTCFGIYFVTEGSISIIKVSNLYNC